MVENQLTKMLDKYPHLREESLAGVLFEVLLEDELNGAESAMNMNTVYARMKLIKTKKGKDYLNSLSNEKKNEME